MCDPNCHIPSDLQHVPKQSGLARWPSPVLKTNVSPHFARIFHSFLWALCGLSILEQLTTQPKHPHRVSDVKTTGITIGWIAMAHVEICRYTDNFTPSPNAEVPWHLPVPEICWLEANTKETYNNSNRIMDRCSLPLHPLYHERPWKIFIKQINTSI